MTLLTEDQVLSLPRCDVELLAIEWLADQALRLSLLLPDKRVVRTTFAFARQLKTDIRFPERTGGRPLTWDISFSRLPSDGWHVLLDFASQGNIEFDCSELHAEVQDDTAYPDSAANAAQARRR